MKLQLSMKEGKCPCLFYECIEFWTFSLSSFSPCHSLLGGVMRIIPVVNERFLVGGKAANATMSLPSVVQLLSCLTLCDPMNCSTTGFLVHHYLPEFAKTHVHLVSDAIQPSHPLLSPSPAFSLSQHQGLFQWVSSSHQVAKVLEFQLQHQSFQWIFRTDLL